MPWWAITASIIASELSAATFLGTPGEGFADRNFFYAQLAIGTILARVIVAYLFIRAYYDYNVVSIYELMEERFGPITKNAASAVFLLTRLLASGTRLYAPSIILVLAVEVWLPPSPSLELSLYAACIIAITLLTTIYTALGGIRAVVLDRSDSGRGHGGGGFLHRHLATPPGGRLGGGGARHDRAERLGLF